MTNVNFAPKNILVWSAGTGPPALAHKLASPFFLLLYKKKNIRHGG